MWSRHYSLAPCCCVSLFTLFTTGIGEVFEQVKVNCQIKMSAGDLATTSAANNSEDNHLWPYLASMLAFYFRYNKLKMS